LTKDPVIYFATTSGITDIPKFIPITERRYKDFIFENLIWLLNVFKYNKNIFKGNILYFTGPKTDGKTDANIPFGPLSGFIAFKQKEKYKDKIISNDNIFNAKTFSEKMDAYYNESIGKDVRQISFAFPLELLLFMKSVSNKLNKVDLKLRDIYPNISVIGCFKKSLSDYFLNAIVDENILIMDVGIRASEGTISIGCNPYNRDSIPAIQQTFLEFKDIDTDKIYLVNELKENKKYEVILTNFYGLYRYNIGDIIKVTGWKKNLPLIEFVGRNKTLDIVGEHSPYSQIELSVNNAKNKANISLIDYTICPNFDNELPCYDVIIETSTNEDRTRNIFLKELDIELQNNILSYERMRNRFSRLSAPRLLVVKSGSFDNLNKKRVVNESQPKSKHIINNSDFKNNFEIDKIYVL